VSFDDVRTQFPDITLPTNEHIAYYGVYDGHGGAKAAAILQESLHLTIMKDPAFAAGDVETAIKNGFASTDTNILAVSVRDGWRDGSTAIIAIVIGKTLYIANAGDSEAVLAHRRPPGEEPPESEDPEDLPTAFNAQLLSFKHKPNESGEKERIKEAGGRVIFGRVMGSLAVARSFGDRDYKHPYNQAEGNFVSAEPYISKIQLTDDDPFLICSCDGLWDRTSYQQAVNFVVRCRDDNVQVTDTAQRLVRYAIDRGSLDNVTAIVIFLGQHASPTVADGKTATTTTVPKSGSISLTSSVDTGGHLAGAKVRKAHSADVASKGELNMNVLLSPRDVDRIKKYKLPSGEPIVEAHQCQLQGKVIRQQGTMLVTASAIFFCYSQFGKKKTKTLKTDQIQSMHFVNSLPGVWIRSRGKKYEFVWKDAEANMNNFVHLCEMKAAVEQSAKSQNVPAATEPEKEGGVSDDDTDGTPEITEDKRPIPEDNKKEENSAIKPSDSKVAIGNWSRFD